MADVMISYRIRHLREQHNITQAELAKQLGITRSSVNAWEMELSSPTAAYLVEMALLFHTTTDDILGLDTSEQICLRGMSDQEKRLVYDLVDYITEHTSSSDKK